MTNFHVILTKECGDAPLIAYLFLLYMCGDYRLALELQSPTKQGKKSCMLMCVDFLFYSVLVSTQYQLLQ